MSETTEEYTTSNDDLDLEQHIEQECIQGSYQRFLPLIQELEEKLKTPDLSKAAKDTYLKQYVELARFALDYLTVKKEIDVKRLESARKKDFAKVMENPV